MKYRRGSVLVFLLIGAAIIFLLVWKREPETSGETKLKGVGSERNSSDSIPVRDRPDSLMPVSRSESRDSKRDVRVIASAGKGVVLRVSSDGTYQLSLSEAAGDIFVPTGKEFFRTTFSETNPVPAGVWIKVRNGNGEILTTSFGPEGWYSPAIHWSGGEFILPNEERELLRADQRSADFKLSDMLMMLRRNLKNQGDLEFKLSVRSFLHDRARDANAEPLASDAFPEYETDWLDGDLLFVGE